MDSLTLKLILTPALVGIASLAGRRWGSAVSGWLVALPLTSGPIVFFLALTHGVAFATSAAVGTLAGTLSQAAFCLAYAWLAVRWDWPGTLAVSCVVFAAATAVLQHVVLSLVPLFLTVILALGLARHLMPRYTAPASASVRPPPHWDIPARMGVATAFVLLLTGLAPALGPQLTGLLAPFPLYGAILAVFAQHLQGPIPAIRVLRGLLLGLFAFATFFLVLAALIARVGIAAAFGVAGTAALVLQAGTLWTLRRTSG
jgi:hypothetical protein